MNIYIANLDNSIDDETLTQLFSPFGEVRNAEIVKDLFTGMSRGFGYIEMEDTAAQHAIKELHQTVLHTLTITVEEAPPKKAPQRSSYKAR